MQIKVSELRLKALRDLHSLGWNDKDAAEIFAVSGPTIRKWRGILGLGPNLRYNRVDQVRARELYDAGESDRAIARALEVDPSAITLWRQKLGLKVRPHPSRLSDEKRRAARKLLRQGASSPAVMAEIGCCKKTVMRLRKAMQKEPLRKGGANDKSTRIRVMRDPTIRLRMAAAIGDQVPQDIRNDAIADMYLDVLEGRLAIDQIERRAGTYRSKAFDMCGSKFGAVSLDAENEDGLTLLDTLADDSWSSLFE